MKLEATLEQMAEKIISLDEASLASLWSKYREKMNHFEASKDWERAVIVFFIINAVRAKNQIFNEQMLRQQNRDAKPTMPPKTRPDLKRVK